MTPIFPIAFFEIYHDQLMSFYKNKSLGRLTASDLPVLYESIAIFKKEVETSDIAPITVFNVKKDRYPNAILVNNIFVVEYLPDNERVLRVLLDKGIREVLDIWPTLLSIAAFEKDIKAMLLNSGVSLASSSNVLDILYAYTKHQQNSPEKEFSLANYVCVQELLTFNEFNTQEDGDELVLL